MKHDGPDNGPRTLLQTLDAQPVPELKPLAALLMKQSPARKAELVTAIAARFEGDGLRALYDRLDVLQKAVVAEVVHSPSHHLNPARFEARHDRRPVQGSFGRSSRERPTYLDLFFYGSWFMPKDIKERLQDFVPVPGTQSVRTVAAPPDSLAIPGYRWNAAKQKSTPFVEHVPVTVREMERSALQDLHAVLRLTDSGKLSVTDKTRRPTPATCASIARVLMGGDFYQDAPAGRDDDSQPRTIGPIRAFAWPMLIQAGKLARPSGSRLQLTPAGQKALAAPPAEVLRDLWGHWVETDLLDELARVESVRGQTGKGKRGLTDPVERREAIAEALAECPPGQWVGVDEFFRYILAADHAFEVTTAPWYLYFGELQYGSLGGLSGAWTILEERYTLCVLVEYLATLGFVDLALAPPHGARSNYGDCWGTDDYDWLSRYDGLLSLRLTNLGAFGLGVADTQSFEMPPLETRGCLRVLDTRDIVLTGEGLSSSDRLLLEVFAERSADVVWKLTPESLISAVESGHRIEELREFLLARSVAALPAGIERFLAETAARCARLHDLGTARLIECSDTHVASLIANDARAPRHCLLAGERHLVVRAAAEKPFRRALRELGYALPPVSPKGSRRVAGEQAATSPAPTQAGSPDLTMDA